MYQYGLKLLDNTSTLNGGRNTVAKWLAGRLEFLSAKNRRQFCCGECFLTVKTDDDRPVAARIRTFCRNLQRITSRAASRDEFDRYFTVVLVFSHLFPFHNSLGIVKACMKWNFHESQNPLHPSEPRTTNPQTRTREKFKISDPLIICLGDSK